MTTLRAARLWRGVFTALTIAGIFSFSGAVSADDTMTASQAAATAAPAPSTNTTTATSEQSSGSFLKKMYVNYYAIYNGASVTDPGSIYVTNPVTGERDTSSRIYMKNYIDVAYRLNDHMTIGPMIYLTWEPVPGANTQFRDPAIKFRNTKVFHTDKFNLSADLRFGLPISRDAWDTNRIGYIASLQHARFELGGRWSAGLYTFARAHFYNSGAVKPSATTKAVEIYAGPYVEYKISSVLSASVLYEANAVSWKSDSNPIHFQTDIDNGTDIEPMLSWDILPNLNFSPYINLATNGRVTMNTTNYGALINWQPL